MIPKLEGQTECKNCGEEIKWIYVIPNKLSDRIYDVHTAEPDKATAKAISIKENDEPEVLIARCMQCDYTNTFDYTK
ncbi:hypothetical protein [Candidatus Contubernalis alkaliaceticus]|uniref:hypothetical protein n=1 Tax=Candidatus Contubernalis alkaliaceticus TaxID=338645 RepID=UPI001F4C28AF|nr:hypothetical protein [Candidatus Contubernalis alkalaceticus]UNC91685.1 hypothetical protein HUE98_06005 [Candidatus Contubernalis alkalaceticus]